MDEKEFAYMLSHFDQFMEKHGYLTVIKMAEKWCLSESHMRRLCANGRIDTVLLGNKRYIKADTPYPERKNKAWKGRRCSKEQKNV